MRKPITRRGYNELLKKLEYLEKVERPQNVKDIAEARAHGDISENAEFSAAKEKQAFIEGKMAELKAAIANSQIIDVENIDSDVVMFGATVHLQNVQTGEKRVYTLVGEYETNIQEGRISITSPIARALLKKEEGDVVKVNAPGGIYEYEILKVEYKE
ncbi:MAG: transcription elongation factor GreA [Candidatus Schekmanbacteria bacterium]|nr:MAG: transcription elongation factor GreA [Candidatus Schekmanbacteria bacterium]